MSTGRLSQGAAGAPTVRAAIAAALCALFPPGPAPAQSDILWRRTMPQAVESTRLDAQGHLLVFSGDGVTALTPGSGEPVWRFRIHLPVAVFRHLSPDHLLLGSGRSLALLDLATGVPIWRRTET